jgi:hypothetical protein
MASATYLTLCNRVLRAMNEVELTSSTFTTTRGFHSQVKDAVNASIREINEAEFEWPFNHVAGSQVLTPGERYYDFPATFKTVDLDTFKIARDDGLQVKAKRLTPVMWEDYTRYARDIDDNLDATGYTLPRSVYRTQDGHWGLTPPPDLAYTVNFEYFSNPTELSAYTDTTTIPATYDHVIVDGALYHGFLFRDNPEGAAAAYKRFDSGIKRMRTLLINRYQHVSSTMISRSRSEW